MGTEELLKIIEDSAELIIYTAPGFLFVGFFLWIIKFKFSSALSLVIAGIIASTIQKMVLSFLGKDSYPFLAMCALSVFFGYVCGVIYKSNIFNWILLHIGIHRTTNETIWGDVVRRKTWICIQLSEEKSKGIYRIGQISNIHDDIDKENECVVLAHHFIAKKTKNDQYYPANSDLGFAKTKLVIYKSDCCYYEVGKAENFGIGEHTFFSRLKNFIFRRNKENEK